jgi:hypothetical protein
MRPPARADRPKRAKYRVAPPRAKAEARPHPNGPAAILVAHGMGQQIPFQTLDDVAEGLMALDARGRAGVPNPTARTIVAEGERVSRLELSLQLDAGGMTREVHIYEGYWAPFTEGRVSIRDVVQFLFRAGWRGMRFGVEPFKRWLFGEYWTLPAPSRTILYLIVALAVVVSLIALNAIIVTVAAARAPFTSPPQWLGPALFSDLTTIMNVLVATFVAFGVVMTIAMSRGLGVLRHVGRLLSIPLFVVAIVATIVSATAAVVVVAHHLYASQNGGTARALIGSLPWAEPLNRDVSLTLLWSGIVIVAGCALWWLARFVRRLLSPRDAPSDHFGRTILVLALTLLMFAAAFVAAFWLSDRAWPTGAIVPHVRAALAWPCVVLAAALVRWFLIEYLGDVVAYVEPQALDKFYELRRQIKDSVGTTARIVYGMQEYEDILVVGHSLGSVVAYDVLNRLLIEEPIGPRRLSVRARTKLLLTFGSPLDKTAFLFGAQGTGTEAREALAASVQPLISDQNARPPWINVSSPFDIISGSLDFYDLPDRSNRNFVQNERDPDASTWIAAHSEYWQNKKIFQLLMQHLR